MTKHLNPAKTEEVTYRDLKICDLEPLADIVASVWHTKAPLYLQRACGIADFANYARRATLGRVAEMNGHAIGVALARAGQAPCTNSAAWDIVRNRAVEDIRADSPEVADELLRYLKEEERVDAELLAESGEDERFELVLFAVSEETRGHGVGTSLLSQVRNYLKDEGATSLFLFTDSTCTWQYYEAQGMRRSAKRTLEEDGETLEMYVYAEDFK